MKAFAPIFKYIVKLIHCKEYIQGKILEMNPWGQKDVHSTLHVCKTVCPKCILIDLTSYFCYNKLCKKIISTHIIHNAYRYFVTHEYKPVATDIIKEIEEVLVVP